MTALLTEGCLKQHPFLNGCSCEFLNQIEEFAREVSFTSGDTILVEGEYADRCYLICKGKIQVTAAGNGKPPLLIQVLGPGDVLGWSWLYPPFEWHFSAQAIEPCEVLQLNAAALLIRAEEDPSFGYDLMKRVSMQLVQRLQATRKRLAEATQQRQKAGRTT